MNILPDPSGLWIDFSSKPPIVEEYKIKNCESCGAPPSTNVKNMKDILRCEYCGSYNDIVWEN